MAAVDVAGLRVEVAGRAIVDGVSFTAHAGRVTAVVGSSGSGKTTTGLALLGEYPAGALVSGRVTVPEGLVGYVPQSPAAVLNPARRVGALLHDIARRRGRFGDRLDVTEALRLAQLPDADELLRRYPHQLSGGQQQRVVIAQALLLGARVLVADEPTTGQDALTKRRVADELAAVARRGVAVVLLTHDLDVVGELADDVVVLRDGRVAESGTAAGVLAAPGHEWTRELLASRPRPHTRDAVSGGTGCLSVHDVTARHGRSAVLHQAGVTVAEGECLAVLGRSGSGKTTLARCVAGLHRDYTGEIRLEGPGRDSGGGGGGRDGDRGGGRGDGLLPRSVRSRSRAQLAAVQYVFQDARAAFDEHRPVTDQIARTAVRLRGLDPASARAEAERTLAEVGLTREQGARRPAGLSGGELQRAALARALPARPRVLVCDEITSGLDTVTQAGILALLERLRHASGLAVVLITHDLAVAAATGDRIAVLDGGRVVETGTARQVLHAPRHPFTRQLTGSDRGVRLT